jgi:hypothetical protein
LTVVAGGGPLVAPAHVSVDFSGNLLATDEGANRVFTISPSGSIHTIAGNGVAGDSGDNGPAIEAQLRSPAAAVFDGTGNIYIADRGNGRLRHVDASGIIRNLLSDLAGPSALALDGLGNLYFTEEDAHRVLKLDLATGLLTSVAEGKWQTPHGLAAGYSGQRPTGEVYVADIGRAQVLKIASSGHVDVIAGTGVVGYSGDGGAASDVSLASPTDVAVDGEGRVYIAESGSGTVRRLDPGLAPASEGIEIVSAITKQAGPVAPGTQVAILHVPLRSMDAASVMVFVNATPAQIIRGDDSEIVVLVPEATDTSRPIEFVVASPHGIIGSVMVGGDPVQ